MNPGDLRQRVEGAWTERADGWWVSLPAERIHAIAHAMREGEARFAALVARPLADGRVRLSWHWDREGTLLSVETTIAPGAPVPSIAELCPAADWAEREVHEYYAVRFDGRADIAPLMLREGDAPGVLLREPERRR